MLATADATEREALAFRLAVLALAGERGADSEVVALALAGALADVAAALDRRGGVHSLADRLHAFCARVEAAYAQLRNAREAPCTPGRT